MSKQSFIQGTLILLAAGIVNRILGFIPRITLPRVIGAEGIGLYQMGWPLLSVILTLVTGGIPIAVAKLVAEAEAEGNEARVRTIFRTAMAISGVISIFFSIVSLFAAPWISTYVLTDSRVYYTFLCMTPIILIVGISSVFRGYFQGRHNMIPTALSQIAETMVRIVTVLVFAWWMLPRGVEYAAAGAMAGVLAGEICALTVLALQYVQNRQPLERVQGRVGSGSTGRRSQLVRIVKLALPVTGSRLVGSFSYFVESIIIIRSLAVAGIATGVATAQYGALQGMVFPLLLLPGALTTSLSVVLVPNLSEAAARNDMRTIHMRLSQALKLALTAGAPFAMIMFVLAEPLCLYLYNQPEVGAMLRMMAPVALFIYFQGPLQAALQALERPGSALMNTVAGSLVKLPLIYLLASRPEFGILGAILAININIVLVTMLHWGSLSRLLKFRMQATDFMKTAAAVGCAAPICYAVMHTPWTDMGLIRFATASASGFLAYLILCLLLRLIDRQDVARLILLIKRFSK